MFAALAIFAAVNIEPMWLLRTLGSDDASYYSHAATLALDFDMDYSNEPVKEWNRAHTIAAHPIGTGIMAAPFVAVASTVDRMVGHPVIETHRFYRYSWSLFGIYIAAVCYFLLGIWFYWRALSVVWPRLDPRLNFLFALSTGVPFYVLRRFSTSHAFEFASCAFALWASVYLYRALARNEPARRWILLCAAAALLNLCVRIANLNAIFLTHTILLVLFVTGLPTEARPAAARMRNAMLKLAGAIAVALVPLGLFNLYHFGSFYPKPSAMYATASQRMIESSVSEKILDILTLVPNLLPLVFGSEFGVLYTNPILVVGGVALLAMLGHRVARRREPAALAALIGALAYFGLNVAIVLWWRTTASAYGFRYLFPLYPLALLGLVIMLRNIPSSALVRGRVRLRSLALAGMIALCTVSIVSETFFNANRALAVSGQVNIFGRFHSASANGYMVRLPREIVQPSTWVEFFARRLGGFWAGPLVMNSSLRSWLPRGYERRYNDVYADVPFSVYLQTLIILVAWSGAGAYLLVPRGPQSPAESRRSAAAKISPPVHRVGADG